VSEVAPDGVELLRRAIARDDGKATAELLVEMHMALEGLARERENEARRRRRELRAGIARFAEVPASARVDDLLGLGADDLLEQLYDDPTTGAGADAEE